jgi:Tfp pilus assembly protein PilE
MMDLSNKSMALILVGAIILSLGGTIVTLNKLNEGVTARAVSTGLVNLTVSSNANCNVDSNIYFGTSPSPEAQYVLSSDRDNKANASGWNNCTDASSDTGASFCKGLQINNTGNVHLQIGFNASSNASTLLVSQNSLDVTDFQYYIRNGTYLGTQATQGCRNASSLNWYNNVSQQQNTTICYNLTTAAFGPTMMTMEFNITLKPGLVAGEKRANITIECQQSSSPV